MLRIHLTKYVMFVVPFYSKKYFHYIFRIISISVKQNLAVCSIQDFDLKNDNGESKITKLQGEMIFLF